MMRIETANAFNSVISTAADPKLARVHVHVCGLVDLQQAFCAKAPSLENFVVDGESFR